jgi:hypothetical protein
MAKVTIPLDEELLDDLARALARRDFVPRNRLLTEWTLPQMPKSLKGEIRSDELPPPHFHVVYDDQDASFSILDGRRLSGVRGLERYDQVIWTWWKENERKICETWNKSRPTDCTVGPVPIPEPPKKPEPKGKKK